MASVVKSGSLQEGQAVYMEYGRMGKAKTRFEGIIRRDGIEVNGTVSSPSISALRCIPSVNPDRTATNGWKVWKTEMAFD